MGTMLFSGGMVPTYLVVKDTGPLNTLWALIIPGAVGTYNIILVMNFMISFPAKVFCQRNRARECKGVKLFSTAVAAKVTKDDSNNGLLFGGMPLIGGILFRKS